MKSPLRQGLRAASAILALVALPLLAGPRADGERGRGGHFGRLLPPPSYLDLTEEQKAATDKLREETKAKIRPILEGQRQIREDLRAQLEAAKPDATTVGQLTIQLHQNRQAVKDILLATEQSFIALLNADQKAKYENFRELRSERMHRFHDRFGDRFGGGDEDGPED